MALIVSSLIKGTPVLLLVTGGLATGSFNPCQETDDLGISNWEPVSWPTLEGFSSSLEFTLERSIPFFFFLELCVYFTVISVLVELHGSFVPNAAVYPCSHYRHHHRLCLTVLLNNI